MAPAGATGVGEADRIVEEAGVTSRPKAQGERSDGGNGGLSSCFELEQLPPHLIVSDGDEDEAAPEGAAGGDVEYDMDEVLHAARAAAQRREHVASADLDLHAPVSPSSGVATKAASIAARLSPARASRTKSGGKRGKYQQTATVDELD